MRDLSGLILGRGWNKGLRISGMSGKKQSALFMEKLKYRNTFDNVSKRPEVREKFRLAKLGKNGPLSCNWQGGKSGPISFIKRIRNSSEYKKWKKSVFERDNFSCQICNSKEKIQADHIHAISSHPFEAYLIENGRTLCKSCHIKTPNFGGRAIAYLK